MKNVLKKWWFWVIVGVVIIGCIGAAVTQKSQNDTESSSASSNTSTSISESDKYDKPDTMPSPDSSVTESKDESSTTPENAPKSYGVGETATAKSYKLTVDELNVLESDNQFIQPDEGKEFVEVVLTIENISESDISISSVLNFKAYEDGYAVSEDLTAMTLTENKTADGTLSSGKKLKGSLCYELSKEWSELEIDVEIGFSKDDEIKLLFTK